MTPTTSARNAHSPNVIAGSGERASVDVHAEHDEGDQRDDGEQRERRQAHVDVGVRRPVDDARRRQVEVVPVDVVVRPGPFEDHQSEDERDVGDRPRFDADTATELERAVQEIGDRGHDQGDKQRDEDPVDDEGQERQPEDEEAHVPVEQRVESVRTGSACSNRIQCCH